MSLFKATTSFPSILYAFHTGLFLWDPRRLSNLYPVEYCLFLQVGGEEKISTILLPRKKGTCLYTSSQVAQARHSLHPTPKSLSRSSEPLVRWRGYRTAGRKNSSSPLPPSSSFRPADPYAFPSNRVARSPWTCTAPSGHPSAWSAIDIWFGGPWISSRVPRISVSLRSPSRVFYRSPLSPSTP